MLFILFIIQIISNYVSIVYTCVYSKDIFVYFINSEFGDHRGQMMISTPSNRIDTNHGIGLNDFSELIKGTSTENNGVPPFKRVFVCSLQAFW